MAAAVKNAWRNFVRRSGRKPAAVPVVQSKLLKRSRSDPAIATPVLDVSPDLFAKSTGPTAFRRNASTSAHLGPVSSVDRLVSQKFRRNSVHTRVVSEATSPSVQLLDNSVFRKMTSEAIKKSVIHRGYLSQTVMESVPMEVTRQDSNVDTDTHLTDIEDPLAIPESPSIKSSNNLSPTSNLGKKRPSEERSHPNGDHNHSAVTVPEFSITPSAVAHILERSKPTVYEGHSDPSKAHGFDPSKFADLPEAMPPTDPSKDLVTIKLILNIWLK